MTWPLRSKQPIIKSKMDFFMAKMDFILWKGFACLMPRFFTSRTLSRYYMQVSIVCAKYICSIQHVGTGGVVGNIFLLVGVVLFPRQSQQRVFWRPQCDLAWVWPGPVSDLVVRVSEQSLQSKIVRAFVASERGGLGRRGTLEFVNYF